MSIQDIAALRRQQFAQAGEKRLTAYLREELRVTGPLISTGAGFTLEKMVAYLLHSGYAAADPTTLIAALNYLFENLEQEFETNIDDIQTLMDGLLAAVQSEGAVDIDVDADPYYLRFLRYLPTIDETDVLSLILGQDVRTLWADF